MERHWPFELLLFFTVFITAVTCVFILRDPRPEISKQFSSNDLPTLSDFEPVVLKHGIILFSNYNFASHLSDWLDTHLTVSITSTTVTNNGIIVIVKEESEASPDESIDIHVTRREDVELLPAN